MLTYNKKRTISPSLDLRTYIRTYLYIKYSTSQGSETLFMLPKIRDWSTSWRLNCYLLTRPWNFEIVLPFVFILKAYTLYLCAIYKLKFCIIKIILMKYCFKICKMRTKAHVVRYVHLQKSWKINKYLFAYKKTPSQWDN